MYIGHHLIVLHIIYAYICSYVCEHSFLVGIVFSWPCSHSVILYFYVMLRVGARRMTFRHHCNVLHFPSQRTTRIFLPPIFVLPFPKSLTVGGGGHRFPIVAPPPPFTPLLDLFGFINSIFITFTPIFFIEISLVLLPPQSTTSVPPSLLFPHSTTVFYSVVSQQSLFWAFFLWFSNLPPPPRFRRSPLQ